MYRYLLGETMALGNGRFCRSHHPKQKGWWEDVRKVLRILFR